MKNITKKITFFSMIILILTSAIHAMQGPKEETEANAPIEHYGILPDEIVLHLFSFAAHAESIEAIFKQLGKLAMVNKQFSRVAHDKQLLNLLIEHYLKSHPDTDLFDEFEKAVRSASFSNKIGLVNTILKTGAFDLPGRKPFNINLLIRETGKTLLDRFKNYTEMVELLKSYGAKTTQEALAITDPLLEAIDANDEKEVAKQLAAGIDSDARDQYDVPAIIRATLNRNANIVALLIKHGANVNSRDNAGRSALYYATHLKTDDEKSPVNGDIVKLLLENHATVIKKLSGALTRDYIEAFFGDESTIVRIIDEAMSRSDQSLFLLLLEQATANMSDENKSIVMDKLLRRAREEAWMKEIYEEKQPMLELIDSIIRTHYKIAS